MEEAGVKIEDVGLEKTVDLINLCIPPEKKEDSSFLGGTRAKKRWADQLIGKYGSIAKLAYFESKPVGVIQYLPKTDERLVEIMCIFVPEGKNRRRGVGKSLLRSLIEDMNEPKSYFGNKSPLALITFAFQVSGIYPQHEFYERMGFKRIEEKNPFLLYYPMEEGFVYLPKKKSYIPQEEDRSKALIFINPSCPFCIYFSEKIKESILGIAPGIPTRLINGFEEYEEVEKRGAVSFCIVNQRPIESFILDKENFQSEVRDALKSGH